MTVQEQITNANEYAALWQALMPDIKVPDHAQFLMWVGTYSPDLVSRGLNRAATKVRRMRATPTPMSMEDAVRYASSVMKNESLGIRRHNTVPSNITSTLGGR